MKIKTKLFSLLFLTPVAWAQQPLVFNAPPVVSELFEVNHITTGLYERDFALSPDGSEIFYTLQSPQGAFQTILYTKKLSNGLWSIPEVAPFAGKFSDLEPAFSPDGTKLFFASNRPTIGKEIKDFDIWVVEKKHDQWQEPRNIGLPVNTSTDEFYPSITRSGNLYFTAAYKNAVGKEDIYFAKWDNGNYKEPVPMDTAINSQTYEFNAFVSPDEDYILFSSYGRKDDMGRGDLYMCKRDQAGKWLPAKNLIQLNSDKLDYCPFVSFDKKILFFTSERINIPKTYSEKPVTLNALIKSFTTPQNGGGDIYWVSMAALPGIWKQP